MHYQFTLGLVAAATSLAAASQVTFINHCSVPVYVAQSSGGGADKTVGTVNANGGTLAVPFMKDISTSIKYSKTKDNSKGISQFEYYLQPDNPSTAGGPANWWDLSDLDGVVKGQTHSSGSPFFNDNVEVKPVIIAGKAAPGGTCTAIKCAAGQICKDAYQQPDDVKSRFCPLSSVSDFTIDLCIAKFTKRKDSMLEIAEREVTKKAIAFIA